MKDLLPFDFSDEVINRFKEKTEIPIDFYNNKGQILIYRKDEASHEEIERLFKFIDQGIFYKTEDHEKLTGKKAEKKKVPGLTDTKLLSKKHTDVLNDETNELFSKLRESSSSSFSSEKMKGKIDNLFTDFNEQEDSLVGLINILDLMQGKNNETDVETAIKRTVVSMALKTRGMKFTRNYGNPKVLRERVNNLMMSAMFCDVGYFKMNIPNKIGLDKNEMSYIQSHPLLSYLMVAHDQHLSPAVKHNILTHHRPKNTQKNHNNYPSIKPMAKKLLQLREKYKSDASKKIIVEDIDRQIQLLLHQATPYHEDANILALASEFASLTTKVPWRDPFPGQIAAKMLLNNSFFTYTPRIMREFFDYIALSLVDNKLILNVGDHIVVTSVDNEGKIFFELCQIERIGRHQSRPMVVRLGTLEPMIQNEPKLKIMGFDLENIKKDRRKALFDLNKDESRHLSFVFDQEITPEQCEGLSKYCAF